MALKTPLATLSWPNLTKPKAREADGKLMYSCALIFSPDAQKTPEFREMKQQLKDEVIKKFGSDVDFKKLKLPFKSAEDIEGFGADWVVVNCASEYLPSIVDVALRPVVESPAEIGQKIWGGQVVRAYLNPYAWGPNKGGRGGSFGLNALQILEADPKKRLDNRANAAAIFNDGKYSAASASSDDAGDDDDLPF